MIFNNNEAKGFGGAISSETLPEDLVESTLIYSKPSIRFPNNLTTGTENIKSVGLIFGGTSKVKFMNNTAVSGGAIFSTLDIIFRANSTNTFANDRADNGGAVYFEKYTNLVFKGNSMMQFMLTKMVELCTTLMPPTY